MQHFYAVVILLLKSKLTRPLPLPGPYLNKLVQVHHRKKQPLNFSIQQEKDQNPTNPPRTSCLVFHEEEENSLCQRSEYQSPTTTSGRNLGNYVSYY